MINLKNVKLYCKENEIENIENYEEAVKSSEMYACHHRYETHTIDGKLIAYENRLSRDDLKSINMYFNCPAKKLIFLSVNDHMALHQLGNSTWRGKKRSEETLHKMSIAQKSRIRTETEKQHLRTAMLGKKHSEETKQKMSASHKKFYAENASPCKGKHWKTSPDGKRIWY